MTTPQQQPVIGYSNFWQFLARHYPPQRFRYNTRHYPVAFAAGTAATIPLPTGLIQVQRPLFVFEFRINGFVTATALPSPAHYDVGLSMQSGSDWLSSSVPGGGQVMVDIFSGDLRGVAGSAGVVRYPFPWPRECPPNTNLTVTVNNSHFGAVPLTMHASVWGIEIRARPGGQTRMTMM